MAVVGDLEELEAAIFNEDFEGRGAGVDGVFNELFEGVHRGDDYFASGDFVDYVGGKGLESVRITVCHISKGIHLDAS